MKPKREIDAIKHAIQAIHTNIYCSEVEIVFNGYITELDGTRCIFDYGSRDALLFKQKEDERNAAKVDPNDESEQVEESKGLSSTTQQQYDEEPTICEFHSKHEGFNVPMHIDGKKIIRKIKKMRISRLIKLDGNQASIPVQTFLPFQSEVDPQNTS